MRPSPVDGKGSEVGGAAGGAVGGRQRMRGLKL
jgi:hypothetical protein